ncbi:terminase [Ottowia sp. VDI28]|uniref:terminase n=1 Tax=Ottowia sp. VDI28 TaxID=3133968 RepID=UPI003C2D61CE
MATKTKRQAVPVEAGTLEEDDGAIDVASGGHVDEQLGHRWDKAVRRPKRGPHIVAHPDHIPTNAEELARCLADAEWRLFSGCLYQIIVKSEDEEGESFVMPFKPNRAQRRFIMRLWHRNIILKARQLGFTTLIAIMWLDHALFNGNQRCGMIAQDRETAEAIFRDKVVFAYDHLPAEIRERFPLARASTKELLFAHNNSSIRVATSVRGGTIHRLHVSEFGKICAKFPAKADEVVTGSIQAVPIDGIVVIESTAEGANGEFYDMSQRAQALVTAKALLTRAQYRFHFYAWWQDPAYRMDPAGVSISREQHDYFDGIEQAMACKIDTGQRAWYVEKLRNDFAGKDEKMWREYPSTPEEAFQQSTDGNYYAKDMVLLRKRGGIREIPVLDLPVYTFWDIGRSDGTAIWFLQILGQEDRFINYYEEHNEDLRHYARILVDKGYLYGAHFLPHDAAHKRLSDYNKSTREQLQDLLPGQTFFVVPQISELMTGVYATRKHLKGCYFDIDRCDQGIKRIDGYKKKYSQSEKRYLDQPDKSNGCTEGADALRQWAQAKELKLLDSLLSVGGGYVEAPEPICM